MNQRYYNFLWWTKNAKISCYIPTILKFHVHFLQLTLSSKHTQNTQKCMKYINYLSLLRSSLLLPNCEGSQSAFIYKFKYKNSNLHASMEGPPCPDMFGEGASLSRWPPSFRSGVKPPRIEPQQWIWVTCYTSTRTQSYRNICKCYVTYLLIE